MRVAVLKVCLIVVFGFVPFPVLDPQTVNLLQMLYTLSAICENLGLQEIQNTVHMVQIS